MTEKSKIESRRTILLGAAMLATLPLVAPKEARAGVVTQKNAKYQNAPKGAAHCAICNYYIPGPKPGADGSCKQVAGVISPNGWCQFFAKKASA